MIYIFYLPTIVDEVLNKIYTYIFIGLLARASFVTLEYSRMNYYPIISRLNRHKMIVFSNTENVYSIWHLYKYAITT